MAKTLVKNQHPLVIKTALTNPEPKGAYPDAVEGGLREAGAVVMLRGKASKAFLPKPEARQDFLPSPFPLDMVTAASTTAIR